jgi:hypothetical protein
MHNTHNGETPGHTNKSMHPEPKEGEGFVETEKDMSWNYSAEEP